MYVTGGDAVNALTFGFTVGCSRVRRFDLYDNRNSTTSWYRRQTSHIIFFISKHCSHSLFPQLVPVIPKHKIGPGTQDDFCRSLQKPRSVFLDYGPLDINGYFICLSLLRRSCRSWLLNGPVNLRNISKPSEPDEGLSIKGTDRAYELKLPRSDLFYHTNCSAPVLLLRGCSRRHSAWAAVRRHQRWARVADDVQVWRRVRVGMVRDGIEIALLAPKNRSNRIKEG